MNQFHKIRRTTSVCSDRFPRLEPMNAIAELTPTRRTVFARSGSNVNMRNHATVGEPIMERCVAHRRPYCLTFHRRRSLSILCDTLHTHTYVDVSCRIRIGIRLFIAVRIIEKHLFSDYRTKHSFAFTHYCIRSIIKHKFSLLRIERFRTNLFHCLRT